MKKKLKNIAEIRTGYQFRERVSASDEANVSVIQIKDVDEQLFVHTSDLVPVKVDNPEPYLVSQGDVLFLSRGHRQYAAIVTEPVQDTIATGYFFIVRPKASVIRPSFLAWTINQPDFQECMRPYVRGSHIPLVSKVDFQDITIRVPHLAVQDRIMTFQALFEREKQLSAAIQEKRQQLVQAVSQKLITGQLTVQGN
jgi:restriction endonuclease S subunit